MKSDFISKLVIKHEASNSKTSLANQFSMHSLEKKIHSGIIYRYTYSNCKVTYYGKTFRHFFTRATEHMGISNLRGKHLKNVMQSSISDHLLQCNCKMNFDNSDILPADSNRESFDKT